MASFVGAVADAGNNSSRTISFVGLPGGPIAAGDVAVVGVWWSSSSGQTITDPGGIYTPAADSNTGSTQIDAFATLSAKGYIATLAGSETSLTVNFSAICRANLIVLVYRGMSASALNAYRIVAETATTAVHTAPSIATTTTPCFRVTMMADKTPTPTTDSWAQPSGDTRRILSIGASTPTVTAFGSDSGAPVAAGPVSGGQATATAGGVANAVRNVVMMTWALAPSGSGATATAVAMQGSGDVIDPAVLGDRQSVAPTSDITTAGWTGVPGTPFFGNIDETPASAVDYDRSPDNPSASVFEVKFAAMTDPNSDISHVMSLGLLTEVGPMACTAYLMQGATPIASWPVTVTTVHTVYTFVLSQSQAAAITDYTDLRPRVVANG